MGIPAEEFDEPAGRLDYLLCSKCKDVVDESYFVCEAEHLACTTCLGQILSTRLKACPAADAVCTATWNLRKSGFVQRQLDQLKRRCRNRRYGCSYTGTRSALDEHLEECGFIATRCECGLQMLKRDYAEHRNRTCLEAPTICERAGYGCSAKFKRREKAAHDVACQRYRCKYVTQGCQSYGTKATISQHETAYCGVLQARLQALETASTNSRGEVDDCRATIRMLTEENTALQSKLDEAREKAADAEAQREIMASASQQSPSSKRKRTKSVTASPLKAKSSQETRERKRTKGAASQNLAIDEESGMSSSSDFEMDQEDDRLVALQLVKEEDGGPNLYRQEIAEIKRQLVEKDVEIARLTQMVQKLEVDAGAQKKKLYAKDAEIEDLREELNDKEEGLAYLRSRLDNRTELESLAKQDPEEMQAEEDRLLHESPSRHSSHSQEEDDQASDAGKTGDESSGPNDESAASEHDEVLSTDEPTPPPPPLSSTAEPPSDNTVKSGTSQADTKTSATQPRPRIWRTSQTERAKPTLSSPQAVPSRRAKPTASNAQAVKKEAHSTSAARITAAPIGLSSSDESDEELPTVEELFRNATQRPANSQRPLR